MMRPLELGETMRYQCDSCLREYEVTLEPKVAERQESNQPTKLDNMAQACPAFCPFCGKPEAMEV